MNRLVMGNKMIRAGIIGGAGYTGGEMIRILLHHPHIEIVFVHSRSSATELICKIHTDLTGETTMKFSDTITDDIDVLFLCVGHGESKAFLEMNSIDEHVVIIDLSQDFRSEFSSHAGNRHFVYGLPEYYKEQIKGTKSIANPGCFATAIQLALLPLASKHLLHEVHVTGITGATGAGQKLQSSSHFSWRTNNIQTYKSLSHQHVMEIVQTLGNIQANFSQLHFVPWRGDFTRGIYITAYTNCSLDIEDACKLYNQFYEGQSFVHISDTMIDMKQVVNTNKCLLYLEKAAGKLIIHATIDNLLKGASGQAVQNMNLIFGLPEGTGLNLKSIAY